MSSYTATIRWARDPAEDFARGRYSRAHQWAFDGGHVVPASASPHVVPLPWSNEAGVDPEEAFVAALSSCHMLTFLDLARRDGHVIDDYVDTAEGIMEKRDDGTMWVSRVTLRPRIGWADGSGPEPAALEALHHRAHGLCFIANSVKTEVVVEPAQWMAK